MTWFIAAVEVASAPNDWMIPSTVPKRPSLFIVWAGKAYYLPTIMRF
jgi:hypothetical protein